ncbi:FG-GAP-like repeat-containing protein [Candidatus Marinimicrobia bacterium]|nr:FG-GAP-like repeat-containing protein [Candidatus Neomarinimicrobiota bacterium]
MQIRDILLITILITVGLAQTPSRMTSLLTSEESIFNTVMGDVDADGDNDILFIEGLNKILLAINNNGTYDEVIEIITVNYGTGIYLIDLNNDNALDILIGTFWSPGLVWIENDGLGNFSEVDTISTLRPNDVEIVDLDNDGDIDIAICDHDGHGFIYENDSGGNFTLYTFSENQNLYDLAIYDFDNDGYKDIVSSSSVDDIVTLFYNDGSFAFSAVDIYTDLGDAWVLNTADFDGDDDIDIIIWDRFDITLNILVNDGNENFSREIISTHTSGYPYIIDVIDFDDDGDLDIAYSGEGLDIILLENDGFGSFIENVLFDGSTFNSPSRFFDVDQDGKFELISTTGQYTYTLQMFIFPPFYPNALSINIATYGSNESGDGSIGNPFATIQHGLNTSNIGDTILVQPGTYTENIFWPDKDGLKLFSAGDSSNTTIDGNASGNVIYVNPQNSTIDHTTIIKGFTLTNGSASSGGAMYVVGTYENYTELQIFNMDINGNTADNNGGGIYSIYSEIIIQKSLFQNNSVTENGWENGGGALFARGKGPTIYNTKFKDNNSAGRGGGLMVMYAGNLERRATIINSIFENNIANYGGAMAFQNSESQFVDSTLFINNQSTMDGGGIYMAYANNSEIKNSRFINNQSIQSDAGAIYASTDVDLINNIFVSNSAQQGGAISVPGFPGWVDIDRNLFYKNIASIKGGAIYSADMSSGWDPIVDNTTFSHNKAGAAGSNIGDAVHVESENSPIFQNSNFFQNGSAIINNEPSYTTSATDNWWGDTSGPYHQIQNFNGQGDTVNNFTNITSYLEVPNIDAPILPPANVTKQLSGNDIILTWDANPESDVAGYKIHYGNFTGYSYTTNTDLGNVTTYMLSGVNINSSISITSYDGNIDGTDDQVEGYQSWFSTAIIPLYAGPVWNVSTNGSDDNDGSELLPFSSIQAAIDASSDGDTVLVSAGTYTENINYNGKNIVVGSLFITTGDTSYISSTIIDGNEAGSVIKINNLESSVELSGLTIQNGKHAYGGGIAIDGTTVRIKRCKIIDNHSPLNIDGTGAGGSGGGGVMIRNENNASVTIENCEIVYNSSGSYGGGIYAMHNNNLTIKNSIIANNSSPNTGGIYHKASLTLENCIFNNNSGAEGGAIRSYYQASLTIKNCTFANNSAERGGAIHYETSNAICTIKNSIFWSNTASIGSQINTAGSAVSVSYTNIDGGEEAVGYVTDAVDWDESNTDSDPLFVAAANGDYRLSDYSPAIGAGTAAGAPNTDIEGNLRPNPAGSNPDMGAYESSRSVPLEQTKYYVSTSGAQDGTGFLDSPMSSIQSAINASSDGDTVIVHNGVYFENVNLNQSITLMSLNGPQLTIVDANSFGTVITMKDANSIVLDGFTLRNGMTSGSGEKSGGLIVQGSESDSRIVKNCIIANNEGHQGGGVYVEVGSFYNCQIVQNSANFEGGGIFSAGSPTPYFENCLIAENNCNSGAAISYKAEIKNTTIVNNIGNTSWASSGESTVTNSVLFGNQEGHISGSTATVIHSLVKGGYPGTGNIDLNPLFVDVENGDYHLSDYSPAIGAGTTDGAPTTDIQGNLRPNPVGSNPDMGAYESLRSLPLEQTKYYVSTSGAQDGTGFLDSPMSSIQSAINASSDGDTVLVSAGTYTGNINYNGKNIVVGSLFITTGDTSYISSTIIDGNEAGSVIKINNLESSVELSGLPFKMVKQ